MERPTHTGMVGRLLEELEKIENPYMRMREFIPERQHRCWKESFLNKYVGTVREEIKRYMRNKNE